MIAKPEFQRGVLYGMDAARELLFRVAARVEVNHAARVWLEETAAGLRTSPEYLDAYNGILEVPRVSGDAMPSSGNEKGGTR